MAIVGCPSHRGHTIHNGMSCDAMVFGRSCLVEEEVDDSKVLIHTAGPTTSWPAHCRLQPVAP